MTGPSAILAGKAILVVEDDRLLSPLLRTILEDAGAKVKVADSPAEALRLAKEMHRIDLLVSDVVLPGQSGFQLADELSRITPQLRALFISGYGDPEIGARDLQLEYDSLLKPFLPEDFIAKIVGLIARPRQ